ncbi:DUF3054 family protein [Halovenus sp. WSH3]|uniref:DUF3054 family protein n=1 Tax=Halovenus carboxidivorans TaxID=2692199 RepID=A0A6B0T2M3_9EURY|nr:DUF3054 domain-containing protein [Halovenus carboxidivorans]MXR52498.1 DUF3054 family protein [Halovenus carboxidivorans]
MSYGQQMRPLLRAKLPTSSSMAAVLLGDLLVLFAFIATGQISHGYVFWEAPARTVLITMPAVVGWLVVAVPAGLFVPSTVRNLKRLVPTVLVVWTGAALIAGLIRSTSLVPGNAPLTFLLVNIVFGAVFITPWRVAAGWWLGR